MRERIWAAMVEAAASEVYWRRRAQKYAKWSQYSKLFSVIMALTAVASWSIISGTLEFSQVAAAIFAIVIAVFGLDHRKIISATLSNNWRLLKLHYEILWGYIEENPDATSDTFLEYQDVRLLEWNVQQLEIHNPKNAKRYSEIRNDISSRYRKLNKRLRS